VWCQTSDWEQVADACVGPTTFPPGGDADEGGDLLDQIQKNVFEAEDAGDLVEKMRDTLYEEAVKGPAMKAIEDLVGKDGAAILEPLVDAAAEEAAKPALEALLTGDVSKLDPKEMAKNVLGKAGPEILKKVEGKVIGKLTGYLADKATAWGNAACQKLSQKAAAKLGVSEGEVAEALASKCQEAYGKAVDAAKQRLQGFLQKQVDKVKAKAQQLLQGWLEKRAAALKAAKMAAAPTCPKLYGKREGTHVGKVWVDWHQWPKSGMQLSLERTKDGKWEPYLVNIPLAPNHTSVSGSSAYRFRAVLLQSGKRLCESNELSLP
jgi:hypothetical protein